ncbi:DUF3043 domain-containing protein [Kineococcus rubinsiae]|uniref:DUF3043 domain-containing protein n=1 Tax=Kineococcus rubinsiae TaxID=2609562 RepID=UPI001AD8DC2A|nr:DUF3043 domain-containing protein [Kineococcus rubinsiae]
MFGRPKEKQAPGATTTVSLSKEGGDARPAGTGRRLVRASRKAPVATPPASLTKEGGKGRPTPKRSDAQARNKRPLVPTDRKAASKVAREAAREERARMQVALTTGDERHLPVRDRGAQKRFVRDVVDARRNVGEYFLIIAGASLLISLLSQSLGSQSLLVATTVLIYGMLAVAIADSFVLSRRIKRALAERFGDTLEGGLTGYGVTRALQIRRLRRPIPMVPRGGAPR